VKGLPRSWAAAALLTACACTPPSAGRAERISPNDSRHPAGALRDSALTVDLELRRGRWYPQADDGPSVEVLAFAEVGHPLQIPGPLIRARQGSRVRVRLRTTLTDSTLVVRGFSDSLAVPPGATREVTFTARAPGTYYYWATTSGRSINERDGEDSQLSGAFIADSPEGATSDRLFVLGVWARAADAKEVMTINGKSWPYTECFEVALGDTVRWCWMNPTASSHPMHSMASTFAWTAGATGCATRSMPTRCASSR
jgi:FtsP/CotA-like multicopper oxidase with cupredoxin domain